MTEELLQVNDHRSLLQARGRELVLERVYATFLSDHRSVRSHRVSFLSRALVDVGVPLPTAE